MSLAYTSLRLPLGKAERLELNCGDILKVTVSGQETLASFHTSHLAHPWGYWSMWLPREKRSGKARTAKEEYLDKPRPVQSLMS